MIEQQAMTSSAKGGSPTPKLYKVKELVAILGLDKDTIYRMIRRGAIRGVNLTVGARKPALRVTQEELDRLLTIMPIEGEFS